jgi:FkbM family methyltransferase
VAAVVKRTPLGPPCVRARKLLRRARWGLLRGAAHEALESRQFCKRSANRRRPVRRYRIARESHLDLVPPDLDLEDGVVVDLGANVGDWAAAVLEIAPDARVLAVEPAPEPRRMLAARFGSDRRLSIDPRAVAGKSGTSEFLITKHSHNSSMRQPRASVDEHYGGIGAWNVVGRLEVDTTTVDELVGEQKVSVLKIDVQGLEREVLAGAQGTLDQTGAVLLEVTFTSHYEGDATFPSLHEFMTERGFRLVGISEPFKSTCGEVLWLDACYAAG